MAATRFAVVIPTWNRRETVLLAVESVLCQTRPAEEIYVLCDGCTDGTQEALLALKEPSLRVLDLPKGPATPTPTAIFRWSSRRST